MARAVKDRPVKAPSPREELARFLSRYSPEIQKRARAILKKMRALLPGAVELVYDNYNALVIGFGATERSPDAIFSIALYPRWISLFFLQGLQGAKLPDPDRRLQGKGNQVRHIVLDRPSVLDERPIRALMNEALKRAAHKPDPAARRKLVIKSISSKQRPRRPKA